MNKANPLALPITLDAKRRIASDVREMSRNDCVGIHYKHSEENLLLAKAAIFGQEGTPFYHGIFLFDIEYSPDYPYTPPVLTFINYGSINRLHPNIYASGKICLSVLNTWPVGKPWNSCMTIKSVLLNIQSILTDHPIIHEPGMSADHPESESYTKITRFLSLKENLLDHFWRGFEGFEFVQPVANKYLSDNYDRLRTLVSHLRCQNNRERLVVKLYGIDIDVDYERVEKELDSLSRRKSSCKKKSKK